MFMGLSSWGRKSSVHNIVDANEKKCIIHLPGKFYYKITHYVDRCFCRQRETKFLGKLKLWLNNSSSICLLVRWLQSKLSALKSRFPLKMQKEKISFWGYICLPILRCHSDLIYTANVRKMNLTLSWTGKLVRLAYFTYCWIVFYSNIFYKLESYIINLLIQRLSKRDLCIYNQMRSLK